MKLVTAILVSLLITSSSADEIKLRGSERSHRILKYGKNNLPSVVKGNLGKVGVSVSKGNANKLKDAAAASMKNIAKDLGVNGEFGAKGNKPYFDELGSAHVRVVNVIKGLPVEGANLVVHIEKDGTITMVNGELLEDDIPDDVEKLPANEALQLALKKLGLANSGGEWKDEPVTTVVRTDDGKACMAWKQAYSYETVEEDGSTRPHLDEIFADVSTGYPCNVFPKIYGVRTMSTSNCRQGTSCSTVTTSSNIISADSFDAAIAAAHNNAIMTYNYFFNNFNRDSIDDNGMTLRSRVHYGYQYNNAFWNGYEMTYGDGDGVTFRPLCMDVDVVAHELMHGITERDSGLIYRDESGALNEAWSDIFGAMVDAANGATGDDIWMLGEDIYTPGTPGDALRYMHDPALAGDYDYYPTRYTGSSDNGGVHSNSGIANLAFFLLSQGGSHPRGKTNVQVTGVGMETAAKIFYYANNACLTASSQFADARRCTMQYGRNYGVEQNVNDAWAAVGVGEGDTPPPEPPTSTIQIYDNNAVNNVAVATDGVQNYLMYNVAAGEKVQCTTSGDNGDADLYVRFGSPADPDPYSWLNECASYGSDSNEACTTSAASEHTVAYAAVHAWAGFSGLTVKCVILPNPVKQIYHNVWVQGLSLPDTRFLRFYMQGIQSGDKVRCVLQGNNGDADLYVRFWQQAVMDPDSTLNNCKSTSDNSYEACTTNRVNANTNAYVAVKAWSAFDNLSLKCWRIACKKLYWGCTAHHQCCPGTFCRWKPDGSGRTCRP